MSLAVILAEGRTLTESLSAAEILRAMRAAAPGTAASFGWIGPAPRITRTAQLGVLRGFVTRVAWIGAMPSGTTRLTLPDRGSVAMVNESVLREVNRLGGEWTVSAYAYSAPINGPLSWWSSGSAAVTRTKDQYPVLGGRLDAVENPLGQTTAATRPSTAGEAASAAASGAVSGASGAAAKGAADALAPLKNILMISAVIAVPVAIAIAISSVSSTIRERQRAKAYQ